MDQNIIHTPLITPGQAKEKAPCDQKLQNKISTYRLLGRQIFRKHFDKMVLFVGPCSIHSEKEALQFAKKLYGLQKKITSSFFLIMRVFVEKPRTKNSWKGFLPDPDLDTSCNVEKGIIQTRKLLAKITELNIPIACELVDPFLTPFYQEFLTWGFIGARTSASQAHRTLASSLPFPIGCKNSVDGNVDTAIQCACVARKKQVFLTITEEGNVVLAKSIGNPFAHVVLRGGIEKPNYRADCIKELEVKLEGEQIPLEIVVDCAHGNSTIKPDSQEQVFQDVLLQKREGNNSIRGIMLESYLERGSQSLEGKIRKNVSVTDPCLDWKATQELILWGHNYLNDHKTSSSTPIFSTHS